MIILLNGSPRKHGATATILQYISEQLKRQGLETSIVHVSDLNLQYCIGCCKCYEIGKCIYIDDIEKLSRKIENADGIIIGTPTYASNISGQLKTIIDRGHFVMEQLLYQKYAMSVVTYENYGGKDTSKILNKLLSYSGAILCRSLIIKNTFSVNPLKDKKIKDYVTIRMDNFYRDLSKHRKPKYQSIKHFIIFRFGIFPFVLGKAEKYQGVIDTWKKNGVRYKEWQMPSVCFGCGSL